MEGLTGRLRVLGADPTGAGLVVNPDHGPIRYVLYRVGGRDRVGPLWIEGSPAWLGPYAPPADPEEDDCDTTHTLTGSVLVIGGAARAGPPPPQRAAMLGTVLLLGLGGGWFLASRDAAARTVRVDEAVGMHVACGDRSWRAARTAPGPLELRVPQTTSSCTLHVDGAGSSSVLADVALLPGRSYTCTVRSASLGSLTCEPH